MSAETTPAPKEVPQPASDLREIVRRFIAYHTEPAGLTLDTMKDEAKFAAEMNAIDAREKNLVADAIDAIAASGAPQEAPGDAPRNGVLVPSDQLSRMSLDARRYVALRKYVLMRGGIPQEMARLCKDTRATAAEFDAMADAAMKGPQ